MNTEQNESPFGPVIYAYTRAQAVADGVQVEVTKTAKEAGISFPVFLTRTVFDAYVAVPEGVIFPHEIVRSRHHRPERALARRIRSATARAALVSARAPRYRSRRGPGRRTAGALVARCASPGRSTTSARPEKTGFDDAGSNAFQGAIPRRAGAATAGPVPDLCGAAASERPAYGAFADFAACLR